MTQDTTIQEPITYCETHPDVESELRCGRCERLICPRCLVYTPGGVRCRDCAQLRRPVMYELTPQHYLRAAGTAAAIGVGFGLIGAFLLPPDRGLGFFGIFIALLVGSGAGAVMAEGLTRATRGKRGLTMQYIAIGGLVIAGVVRLAVSGQFDEITRDLIGIFTLVIAIATSWGRLR
jgi:hypothetical protein